MVLSTIPDLAAMICLMIMLLLFSRRTLHARVNVWLVGLSLVLIETIAIAFYTPDGRFRPELHILALDSYVLASCVFIWGSRELFAPIKHRFLLLSSLAVPVLLLNTAYGADLLSPAFFHRILLFGLGIGLIGSILLCRNFPWYSAAAVGFHLFLWMPMFWMLRHEWYRAINYWSLGCCFLLAGVAFYVVLPRRSAGRIAVTAAFFLWALCFFTHPIVRPRPELAHLVSSVWNMQKFLITIGLLMALVEEQNISNEKLALHDTLTGLPNRRLLVDRINQSIERARRSDTRIAVFMMDLNGFKQVNDLFGHAAGDELLKQAANNLRKRVRSSDTLARVGGDEFVLLMGDLPKDSVYEGICIELNQALFEVELPSDEVSPLSASIGIAVYPEDAQDQMGLLKVADERMYANKRTNAGRMPVSL